MHSHWIESVESLATADILILAVKTHYPVRTLIDWIDQAIAIQRLAPKRQVMRAAAIPIGAIELAWMSPANNGVQMTAQILLQSLPLYRS